MYLCKRCRSRWDGSGSTPFAHDLRWKPLLTTMDMTEYKAGRVHYRNLHSNGECVNSEAGDHDALMCRLVCVFCKPLRIMNKENCKYEKCHVFLAKLASFDQQASSVTLILIYKNPGLGAMIKKGQQILIRLFPYYNVFVSTVFTQNSRTPKLIAILL